MVKNQQRIEQIAGLALILRNKKGSESLSLAEAKPLVNI